MKSAKIYLALLIIIPFSVQAQYTGGNGRGDISIDLIVLPLAVEDVTNHLPNKFGIEQNYPNPFNPVTIMQYAVGSRSYVTLKVYDVLGNEIECLVNEEKPAGSYAVKFDGSRFTSGVYFYQLRITPMGWQARSFIKTKKMILLK